MKKNVAGQKIGAQLIDASTGAAFTGAVTVAVTVDAGTQATGSVGSGACTHEGNGYHTYAPSQAETNGDLVAFTFYGTGALPVTVQVYPVAVSAGGRPDVNVGEMTTNVVDAGALASNAVAEIAKRLGVQHSGTCQAGSTSTTVVLAPNASSVDDYYNGQIVALTEWTGLGQARRILDYVGSTRTATVAAWATTPDNTTEYSLLETAAYTIAEIQSGLATASALATVAGYVDTEVAAIQADVTTLLSRLSSARAGYLDNLSAGAVATASNLATLTGYVDTEVAAIQADVTTLLGRLTALRAGYLDNLSAGAVAQASALATVAGYVDTEIANIQSRLPAALVSGRMDASVGAVAAGAITASGIAADAIGSSQLAASAVTEIQTGLATSAAVGAIQTDVDDIQARLPAALVSGRIDASVGAMAANTLTASALASDAVTEMQTGLATSSALATLQADVTRLLGLHNENARIDNTTYTSGKCTAMRVRVFANAAAANASTAGAADDADSEVARYTVAASYTGDELDTYKLVRSL